MPFVPSIVAVGLGCSGAALDDSGPVPRPVPSGGGGPVAACVTEGPRLSSGAALASRGQSTFLAPTETGFVAVQLAGTDVLAIFLDADGVVLETVALDDDVPAPAHAARLVTRPDDFVVVWATEFELGWRTLAHDGSRGERVFVPVFPFTTPVSAEWHAGALEIVVGKPGQPDRVTRYALDGTVLAGPVDVPLSNRSRGVVDHDPGAGRLVHLHTIQAGERDELWQVPFDFDVGPGEREVLYAGTFLGGGTALRRPSGTLVAIDDLGVGPLLLNTDDGEIRATVPNGDRGHPALAEVAGCVALAVQPKGLPGSGGLDLHLFDGSLDPVGDWPLLDVPPETVMGPHQLAAGHGRLALTWTEQQADDAVQWFHTIDL